MYDVMMRAQSEESIRTQDCDGPLPDITQSEPSDGEARLGGDDDLEENFCSDRAELIERIKRGESPTWVPNEAVSGIRAGKKPLQYKNFAGG